MAGAKPGKILAFQLEQGFGRVDIEGEGEMPFDAGIAQASTDDLVPGAAVMVEMGPSRLPGKMKVTKLWRADKPMPLDPTGGDPVKGERMANVGLYELQLPGFWPDLVTKEKPDSFMASSQLEGGISFDMSVLVGKAGNATGKAELFATHEKDSQADRHVRCDASLMGTVFEGHRFEGKKARGPEAVHEVYFGEAYGDLIVLECLFAKPSTQGESLKQLFFTMVGAALVRRGQAIAKATGKPPKT